MLKHEIQVGETYYFVGSDSPTRKHLAGQPFTVVRKERVFRKMPYRRGRKAGTVKVLRFFNDDGIGARAEELEPLPADMVRVENYDTSDPGIVSVDNRDFPEKYSY